ncbi:related to SAC3-leucine permease transcriptional regulator [Sporisorium reilianum SRZ2]|uniref:Related to SAC3-leucine permease transcriptional regulator n=1 Tax=Sporisorium reilianum (strain SRZ2) TaxID=999809 RepID=E7A2Y6_SPORE|nr:related to SAC3-leucine permease transcriptional regulator [Sporisorium reilianum SRZ2]
MQQQNSGSGGLGSNGPSGGMGFSAFGRPQQTPSASTSSAPPNTFFRPPAQGAQPSAFSSGFNGGQQQQHQLQQQQGSAFGTQQASNAGPRPPFQQSSFGGTPRPFNGGQQPRPQRPGFNAARPGMKDHQSSSSFGSRPRPFTARPSGPNMPQEGGRPPHSNSFRGGRGGGSIRPIKPFASHANANQQSHSAFGSSENGVEAGPSNQQAPRPRPRPFANKSTTFNTQAQPSAPAATFGAPSTGQGAGPASAFGGAAASQSDASPAAPSSSFGQPSSSFSSTQTPSGFGAGTSAFGSTMGSSNTAPANSSFGGVAKPSAGPSFGSAFGSSATPSSAFGGGNGGSSFGKSSFAAAPSQPPTSVAPSAPSVPITAPSTSNPLPASAAPTSSFSNFLRKDRSGAQTPGSGAATPFASAGDNAISTADEDELRKKRFEDAPKVGNRFLEMKGGREALRNAYIKSGVLPDPDKPTDLALAVKLVGTCQDMCPEFEREEREFQKELDPLELYPGTDRVDPRIAVKIYRRPAAGRELPLPEDVRPPPVLRRTLDYLFHDLLPADPNNPRFTQVQGFLWNRTRAVRQDFIVQSEGGSIAIECHERIARYHILCLHWRGGPGAEGWSEQQELEQLRKTMRSLIEFYDDNRRKSSAGAAQQPCPNEAEFRAYNLLLHLRDPETLREAELLPGDIFRSPLVQTAINVRQLAQRSNNLEKRGQPRNTEATLNFFSKFFAELRKPSVNYLMACLAENSFSSVRIGAVKAMSKAYMAQHRGVPIERMQHVLGMDSAEQVVAMATHLGLELEWEGETPVGVKIHRSATINEDKPLVTPFSATIVEAKRGSFTSADVVDGRASGARTQVGVQGPTAAVRSTQTFGQPAQNGAMPAFGTKTQQQPGSALGAATASPSPFGQPQPQRDANQSFAFASASPSKLSAAAASFTPTTFGGSSTGDKAASTFGSFSGFGNSNAKTDAGASAKAGLPSFGAFGKDASQTKQEPVAAPSPFGNKSVASDIPPSATQAKPSSLPSFSFGQPAAKESAASAAKDTGDKPAPSFSFGSAAKTDSEISKPAMPSFFGSSLAKQSGTDKKEPASAAPSPLQPAAGKQDSLTPASSALKRRASDPNENAAAQAAAAAKLEAEKKAQAKRKHAAQTYAVERAFGKLSDDVARSLSEKVAARAVQEEDARRRAASRDQLVARITDKLWQQLAAEHAAEVAEEASRVAAAQVFRSRSCAMRAWSRWTEVLQERRDREQQRQRLEDIRSEIRRRNILGRVQADADLATSRSPQKTSRSSHDETSPIRHAFSIRQALLTGERAPSSTSTPRLKRKLEDEPTSLADRRASRHDDAEITERWTRVRRQHSQLWAEGSLLHRLADHIEELLLHFRPAELDRLVVLYSGAPGQHVASSWLRVKFGFSPSAPSGSAGNEIGRDVLEIDLADGSLLELVDVTPAAVGASVELERVLPDQDEHSQPGLVIFETSPAVAQAETFVERQRVLEEDRRRLEEMASSKLVQGGQLACRLLVVSWGSAEADLPNAISVQADGDVEMSDVDANVGTGQQESLLASLGVDAAKTIRSHHALVRPTTHTKPSAVLTRAFERVGVLELTDASVSVEATLSTLLARAMPDLTPNRALYLSGRRRATLEDVALEFYDQWARTSALLLDLLSGLPPSLLSTGADGAVSKAEQLACKTLRIQTALANHILRTVLSLSETVLEDDNAAEERSLEVPPASKQTLVSMALSQLDQLADDEAEHKLHLRASLLSSLTPTPHLASVLRVVNGPHIDALFRYSLDKVGHVWIGVRAQSAEEWSEAHEVFARLCGAAVDEVAAEARGVWAAVRASGTAMEEKEEKGEGKRVRVREEDEEMVVEDTRGKGGKIGELRELIAQTRRFLDTSSATHT